MATREFEGVQDSFLSRATNVATRVYLRTIPVSKIRSSPFLISFTKCLEVLLPGLLLGLYGSDERDGISSQGYNDFTDLP